MSHAAQCLICKHQRSRGSIVTGCLCFEDTRLDARVTGILTALLFQNARRHPCPGFERLEFGPDAYRAEDLPEKL